MLGLLFSMALLKKVIATRVQKKNPLLFALRQIIFYFATVILIGVLNN
jgi:hypothetical protein